MSGLAVELRQKGSDLPEVIQGSPTRSDSDIMFLDTYSWSSIITPRFPAEL